MRLSRAGILVVRSGAYLLANDPEEDPIMMLDISPNVMPARRSVPQIVLLALILVPLLAATAGVSVWSWNQLGDTAMGTQGYVALVIGVLAALAVGAALMGLVFYSSRHGYDDRAGRDQLDGPTA